MFFAYPKADMLFLLNLSQGVGFGVLKRKVIDMKKTRFLTETAVCAAMATILGFLKLFEMPQGGSVSLAMVPILFIAIKRGPVAGCACGVLYGIISVVFAGTVYHPASIFLDYIFAFGALGVAGFFPKTTKGIALGSIAGVCGRFVFSVISGATIFATYAPAGQNPWVYSIIYQGTYMVPELVLAIVVLVILNAKAGRLFAD